MKKIKKDTALKEFWRNNERFADLFNAIFFQGKRVLRPEELEERDTDMASVIASKEMEESIENYRDVLKCAKGVHFMILGIENQDKIHYAMPLRCRVYDDLQYLKQVKEIGERYEGNWKGFSDEEFLSKMKKEDRIVPCLTIVIYYGEKEWDGPRSLKDMMELPKEIVSYFQDYHMHLLCVRDEDGSSFSHKDVRELFYVLNALCHNKVNEIKEGDVQVNNETYRAIAAVQKNEKLLIGIKEEGREDMKMCSALDRIWEDGKKEAREEIIGNLLGIMSREQIAQVVCVSLDVVDKVADKGKHTKQ